jgi:hypothetical protein
VLQRSQLPPGHVEVGFVGVTTPYPEGGTCGFASAQRDAHRACAHPWPIGRTAHPCGATARTALGVGAQLIQSEERSRAKTRRAPSIRSAPGPGRTTVPPVVSSFPLPPRIRLPGHAPLVDRESSPGPPSRTRPPRTESSPRPPWTRACTPTSALSLRSSNSMIARPAVRPAGRAQTASRVVSPASQPAPGSSWTRSRTT